MTRSRAPLGQLRQELIGGIPRYQRRRQRRQRMIMAAPIVVGVIVTAAILTRDTQDGPPERVTTATTTRPEESRPSSPSGVVVATSGNDKGLALVLQDGELHLYEGERYPLNSQAMAGAAVTPSGGVLVWTGLQPVLHISPESLAASGNDQIRLSAPIGSIIGERQVVPTADGSQVWVLSGGGTAERTLELADIDTGRTLLTKRLPGDARLVGAVESAAVVEISPPSEAQRVVSVAPSGETTETAPFADTPATIIAASTTSTVGIAQGPNGSISGERLLIEGAAGAHTIEAPSGQAWVPTGHSTIPSDGSGGRVLNGGQLLVGLTSRSDVNGGTHRIAIVDLDDRSYEVVYEGTDIGTAFWSASGDRVLVVRTRFDVQEIISLDPRNPSSVVTTATLPPRFFVLAGS